MEIFRSGILAIPPAQFEAARALGISRWRTTFRIILPQVITIIRQPYTSQMTIVVKNTALASVVAVPEILAIATRIAISTGRPFEVLFLGSLCFAVLNSLLLALGTYGKGIARRPTRRQVAGGA
jgi:ABC-type amino acid transport system permease subunit